MSIILIIFTKNRSKQKLTFAIQHVQLPDRDVIMLVFDDKFVQNESRKMLIHLHDEDPNQTKAVSMR